MSPQILASCTWHCSIHYISLHQKLAGPYGLKTALQFYTSLFFKSTEPTNIFKLGIKETGQSASAIPDFKHHFSRMRTFMVKMIFEDDV